MGYTTKFKGAFKLNKPATAEQIKFLNTFSDTRRMKRNPEVLMELFKGQYTHKPNDYGTEGEFFAKNDGDWGQNRDASIIEYNQSPSTQPGLWCKWVLSEDGTQLEWNGMEKFYNYVEWLEYLIKEFFIPWEIEIYGIVKWQGEDMDDRGNIVVVQNIVTTEILE